MTLLSPVTGSPGSNLPTMSTIKQQEHIARLFVGLNSTEVKAA